MIWNILIFWYCSLFGQCAESACRILDHKGQSYIVCSYDVSSIDARLFLNNQSGAPFGYLSRLSRALPEEPLLLMNGGMYHDDLGPVGLYVEDGAEARSISTKGGYGNFHLLPNGVFWGRDGKLFVTETRRYRAKPRKPDFATQSGPMLVIDGKLHPRFLKNSDSRKIRNGVGVSKDGRRVHFALSKQPVTFHDFGTLYRDVLKTQNALFLDGTISGIRAGPFIRESWRPIGPIIGVFAK